MKLSRDNMKKFATSVLHQPTLLRDEFVDYYYEALSAHGHAHPFLWINRFSGFSNIRKEFVLIEESLAHIHVPTLIIVGAHDPVVPPNTANLKAFKLLPNATLMIFSESGHVAPTEESVKFNQAVIQFLGAELS
jgi:pimeloyl-ACP methyl ester carboxylesterase